MAVKPCPYRKEHEWAWDVTRKLWECAVCYAVCDKRLQVPNPDDETPTPPHPFLAIDPGAALYCAVPGCGARGKMAKVSPFRWATRCDRHKPGVKWES